MTKINAVVLKVDVLLHNNMNVNVTILRISAYIRVPKICVFLRVVYCLRRYGTNALNTAA